MQKYLIITVLDTISETSMPYNEFILFRLKHYPAITQVMIVCQENTSKHIEQHANLQVYYVGKSREKTKKAFNEIIAECRAENLKYLVHLHQLKSAIQFYKANFFNRELWGKTLFTVHSLYSSRDLKYRISSFICSLLSKKIICVSLAGYKSYSPLVKRIKGRDIIAIQNGVDIERIDTSLVYNNTSKKLSKKGMRTLIYVGRFIPIKNQIFLVRLMRDLNDCRLVLIGEEDKGGEIRKQIHKNGLDERVEIMGFLPRNRVFEELSHADIYVSPSLVEGLPVSVLEAMYVGLPVVLSAIEPHLEIAAYNNNICTIDLGERSQWINTLNAYLQMEDTQLVQIGNESKKVVVQIFSLRMMHENYDKVYQEMIQR